MDILKLIKSHRSIREFEKAKEPNNHVNIQDIVKTAQQASTSKNLQAYSVIHVTDKTIKRSISEVCNQTHVVESHFFLVFCADLYRLNLVSKSHLKEMKHEYTELLITAIIDTALFAQNVMLISESQGLGGVYVGGIRNDPRKICELLNIPKLVFPVFGMSLGFPAKKPLLKPRLPLESIFKENYYEDQDELDKIRQYDEEMKAYYKKRSSKEKLKEETWSEKVSDIISDELRPHIKEFLNEQGLLIK